MAQLNDLLVLGLSNLQGSLTVGDIIYAKNGEKFIKGSYSSNVAPLTLTANRTLSIPDASGVIATIPTSGTAVGSDIKPIYLTGAGVAIASTATVGGDLKPTYLKAGVITEVTNTMAALEIDQTFSGTNTFSKQIIASSGASLQGNLLISNTETTGKNQPYIQWATIGSNTPYTGFAHDQSDGTFIILSMEKNTTTNGVKYYKNGLSIGGGSGNLFWKGDRVATGSAATLGSATKPVYLSDGRLYACNNTLDVSISGTATNATNANNLKVNDTTANTNYYILGAAAGGGNNQTVYRAYNTSGTANTTGVYFNGTSGVLYGAAWNDYAEFRHTDEKIEAGRVVVETGKGDLILSTERLQPGAEIVSDTFGFAIGETDECQTPIAATGRVLAYPYEDRNSYQAGDAVCAGPNGTVSKMTEEEICKYPHHIIGTVSEIPDYQTWGYNHIEVNNRIWIRIR